MMQRFASIQDFYVFLDTVSDALKENGAVEVHQKIFSLLHETAWTTSTELLGELRIVLRQSAKNKLPRALRNQVDMCLKLIRFYLKR